MKTYMISFLVLTMLLTACNKNQQLINDISGDWELKQISYESPLLASDSVIQFQNVVLSIKDCDKEENKTPYNCKAVLIDGNFVIDMYYQITAAKGNAGFTLIVDDNGFSEEQIKRVDKIKGSYFMDVMNDNNTLLLNAQIGRYITVDGHRTGLRKHVLFERK